VEIVFKRLFARQTIELTFEPFIHWTTNFKTSKISKFQKFQNTMYFKISKIFKKFQNSKIKKKYDLFVELYNNKQVEYRVKSPKFVLHVFQYYYLDK
jgi:GTP cyclohydrolase III